MNKKRKISIMLVLILIFQIVSPVIGEIQIIPKSYGADVLTTADGNYEYKILEANTIEISKYKGTATEAKIPNEIDGKTVTSIGNYAFNRCSSLTSVEIPTGVTRIGFAAFYECNSLSSIEIPQGVTNIEGYAFDYCSSLTNIETSKDNLFYSSVEGVLYNKAKTEIIQYPCKREGIEYKIQQK